MPSYWWKCARCNETFEFSEVTNSMGIVHFIWDELLPSNWEQTKLKSTCGKCQSGTLSITYNFPGKNPKELTIIHAVGIGPFDKYLPMMWETKSDTDPNDTCFDFKYVVGRNIFGLNKPAVFTRSELKEVFNEYKRVTGENQFP